MDLLTWFRPKTNSDTLDGVPTWKSLPDFSQAIDDALRLLVYAAETGRSVDDATRGSILRAKAAANSGWDDKVAADLLAALTKLADELKPVTAESLEASCGKLTKPTITTLRKWAGFLAIPIVVFSLLGFVTSSISSAIRTDITTANDLLVKLRSELGTDGAPTAGSPGKPFPPGLSEGDVITQLQLYASTIRAIDARSRQLNWFVFNAERDPFARLRWDSNESKAQRDSRRKETAAGKNNEQNIDTDCSQPIEALSDNECKLKAMFQLPVGL